ncbi:MAG TPA: S8 family serine peptidase [Nocardioidaceae bacterium]|nr:S8 family serine peptidase [Nocardioidaceae bacterium]
MMPQPLATRARPALAAICTTAVLALAAGPVGSASAQPGDGQEPPGLSKHDEQLLSKAKQAGARTVTTLIATIEGTQGDTVAMLERAGATVEHRTDAIGYLRAEVPVDRVQKVAALSGVDALDVDDVIPLPDPRPMAAVDPTPQPAPGASTPRVNPYLPTGDTNAAQFIEDHPTWDGRGATVAVVDTGIDLGHPALRTTSTGERKVVDWVTQTDPGFSNGRNDDNDPTWISMTESVPGASVGLPGEGDVRYGEFDERDPRLGGQMGNDVNRDGNPAGSSGIFGVAWNTETNTVWLDADQDGSLRDEPAMTDYKLKHDVGTFGTDDPATAVRDAVPFVVQTSPETDSVNIGIVSGAHGSHVAGIAAGNELFGGAMTGAAPGAKLVSVRACLFVAGCTAHALLEGMIYAARDANADVINMSIGGLPALNDANNARAELYDRIIDTYDVQMFISAGNEGAGTNTIGDPAVAGDVIAVGSYITRETWRSNYGSDLGVDETLHTFSSRGPREDGGFKPNVVAPGSAISTTPTWQAGQPLAGTYELPPGYGHFNGTSMASPQAAGAAALLVSAAKARNIDHSAAALRAAFQSTARFLDDLGAHEQGNGLIDTRHAWNMLRQEPERIDVTMSVPVNTILDSFLATPGVGVGIYDREGVTVGDSYVREYTFTRTSGPDRSMRYKVRWVGDDGTFSSAKSVTLPKDEAVTFPVTVNPAAAGIHSAILNLDNARGSGIDAQALNTVVAAEEFTADNRYTVSVNGQVGRNQVDSYFYRVPAGAPAFKVQLEGGGAEAGAGQIRFLRFHPYGLGIESNTSNSCYNPPGPRGECEGRPTSRTVSDPQPGVWEVVVEARRTSDAMMAPYTLTATMLGASVSPNPDVIAAGSAGTPVTRDYTVANAFGSFTGRAVGTRLGSARVERPTITSGAQQQHGVTIEPGATSVRAAIGNTADGAADLDLYLFDCTSGTCTQRAASADGDSEEAVEVANPTPGQWVVMVHAFSVPAGTTEFDYLDVFDDPAFGSVVVDDEAASRATGETWTVPATVTANAAPAPGRVLLGNIEVRTNEEVLVGSGDVVVQSVTE